MTKNFSGVETILNNHVAVSESVSVLVAGLFFPDHLPEAEKRTDLHCFASEGWTAASPPCSDRCGRRLAGCTRRLDSAECRQYERCTKIAHLAKARPAGTDQQTRIVGRKRKFRNSVRPNVPQKKKSFSFLKIWSRHSGCMFLRHQQTHTALCSPMLAHKMHYTVVLYREHV